MDMSFDDEIKIAELEVRLSDQETALKKVKVERMRLKKRDKELETTEQSLKAEIEKSKEMISFIN